MSKVGNFLKRVSGVLSPRISGDKFEGASVLFGSITGMLKAATGVVSAATAGTDYFPPQSSATVVSSATPTPAVGAVGANIFYTVTALAEAATFGAPTGTPVEGQILTIRIEDDGTARGLAWNAIYRAGSDMALPTTTVLGKVMYVQFVFNNTDTKWDLVSVMGGF